ncbi:HAMP domain-containing sensor histidine kinase [Streptomyces sp. DSM 44917]|uniref:histidine kinase n=1 Tax=Streptomyces boetiae TaxID=3075541 RepID=A0ABU2L5Z0_9ACTN|nr:HAMP domain-containing sensor histidine kinase [Streptomyces sp. DSM 44917]MDT0306980.1 HAMP domain-containing sensor histidine kinase [Streptomyces sp. DSM 44917]
MGSVRARAALGATAVVAVALIAAGLVMLGLLRGNLGEQVDLQADVAARDVAGQLATGTGFEDLELDGDAPVQVVDGDGLVRAVNDGLEAISGTSTSVVTPQRPPAQRQPAPGEDGDDDSDAETDSDSDDDDDDEDAGTGLRPGEIGDRVAHRSGSATIDGRTADYRFAQVEVTTTRGEAAVVHAGAPVGVERAAVDSVRDSMLVGVPALLAVVAAVTWLVTRRALRPVEGIRREMAAITRSTDLTRRVPEPPARDEIGRLARTTNETLAALEHSVERQRRFVADASHELRSPIASLRTQLEVAAAHPELLDLPGAVEDTVRLQTLAADLLLLARLDAGERPQRASVEPADLVAEVLRRRTGDRVPVRAEGLAPVRITGSPGQLARVLGNLLDNAQRHAASAVRVSVRAGERGRAVVEVADDGPGVPEEDRERIFERFVRLDDARSRDEGGAGLGLAIARDVAERHGGTLTVSRAPEGGALFALTLPPASPAPDDGAAG